MPALGEDGAEGPADAGAEDEDRAEELARAEAGVAGDVRPEQDGDADDAQRDAGDAARGEAVGAVGEPLQNEEPERNDGGQQRGQAGGNVGFRPPQHDVGGDEEKDSDDGQAQQIAARDEDAMSAEAAEAEHEQARRGEAQRAHQQRSEMLDRDADGQVGGAPEDVNQSEGDDGVQPSGRVGGSHGAGSMGKIRGINSNVSGFGKRPC